MSRVSTLLFFFNDPATPEIYTLSLHDALPISLRPGRRLQLHAGRGRQDLLRDPRARAPDRGQGGPQAATPDARGHRSEEHTSELQSRQYLVCRLLLEKKKNKRNSARNDRDQQ